MAPIFANRETLVRALQTAHASGQPLGPCDLTALRQVLEYAPEDMTMTVEGGLTVAELQATAARHGQWLPLDPPRPDRTTINDLLQHNLHGPRRYGYGLVRDALLGLTVAVGDGRLIRSGGKVVKNVAGYDMAKLFIGSAGTLGLVVEATFKLLPKPEREIFLRSAPLPHADAAALLLRLRQSPVAPVVLDLAPDGPARDRVQITAGFAGTVEQTAWQESQARSLGLVQPGDLNHEFEFWKRSESTGEPLRRQSVLPTLLLDCVNTLQTSDWVARAGNGLVHYRGGINPAPVPLPWDLMRKVKATLDPAHVLPPLPWS